MKIQATFYDMQGNVYKSGEYKTMRAMKNARERYELQYGACLRTEHKEVMANAHVAEPFRTILNQIAPVDAR